MRNEGTRFVRTAGARLAAALISAGAAGPAEGQAIPPGSLIAAASSNKHYADASNALARLDRTRIEYFCRELESTCGVEAVVAVVPALGGKKARACADELGMACGIGKRFENPGGTPLARLGWGAVASPAPLRGFPRDGGRRLCLLQPVPRIEKPPEGVCGRREGSHGLLLADVKPTRERERDVEVIDLRPDPRVHHREVGEDERAADRLAHAERARDELGRVLVGRHSQVGAHVSLLSKAVYSNMPDFKNDVDLMVNTPYTGLRAGGRSMPQGPFAGKVAAVTAGAAGIGLAIAERLARESARLAVLDVDGEAPPRAAHALEESGATALGFACDVTDGRQCEAAISDVAGRFGGTDLFVNDARRARRSFFEETDPEVHRRVMEVNFLGAVYCSEFALSCLIERRGLIDAISSGTGFAPLFGRSGYAASEHARHGFFDALRAELADRGVGVLIVRPSFTATGIAPRALDGDGQRVGRAKSALGRRLGPGDVAEADLRAAARRGRCVLASPLASASSRLSRLFPGAYDRLMRATQRAEFASAAAPR
jgi:NAD(P)-dependent dehydrogenase (short-subunit alcohol dehydrogenase family)